MLRNAPFRGVATVCGEYNVEREMLNISVQESSPVQKPAVSPPRPPQRRIVCARWMSMQ